VNDVITAVNEINEVTTAVNEVTPAIVKDVVETRTSKGINYI
jgi:hypothetical protein